MPDTPHNYHYTDSYLAEAERRLNHLTSEVATLKEKSLNIDKTLERLELSQSNVESTLAEIQITLQRITSYNEGMSINVDRQIDSKLLPIQKELEERREEVIKLKTAGYIISSILSGLFIFAQGVHTVIARWFGN